MNRLFFRFFVLVMLSITAATFVIYFVFARLFGDPLDDIARRLIDIRERYGARAVALAKGTPGGTSVSDAERWLARFLNRFGSPNWTSTTHVCNWHKDTGFTYTFGVEIPAAKVYPPHYVPPERRSAAN